MRLNLFSTKGRYMTLFLKLKRQKLLELTIAGIS